MLHSLTLADKILLLVLSAATIMSYFLVEIGSDPGSTVLVEVDGQVVYKADLHRESTFMVHGVLGEMTVEVRDGHVSVTRADCPNRVCVRMGRKSRSGDVIVCVPNKAVIHIGGVTDDRVRAITG